MPEAKKPDSASTKPDGAHPAKPPKASDLGVRLRQLSDKALAAGIETMTLEQIRTRIVDVRGGLL